MSLVIHHRNMGNLKVFDVRCRVNLNVLKPVFERLIVDPYVTEGFRHKHIAWFRVSDRKLERLHERNTLYQSNAVNPIHGGIKRVYPTIMYDETMLERILDVFMNCAEAPLDEELAILLQFQRITARPGLKGKPSVENWHHDNVRKIGIICVGRENVRGGVSQFKREGDDTGAIMAMELPVGHMAVFDDAPILHRVTDIECDDDSLGFGYRDVILLAYGTPDEFGWSSTVVGRVKCNTP